MAQKFPRQESITLKISHRAMALLAGLCLTVLATGAAAKDAPGYAGQAALRSLAPYSAQYETTARGMSLNLTRNLKKNADGSYTLTNGGKIMVVGFHEMSVFNVEGTTVMPRSYVYQGTGLINRRREVHFTPGTQVIRSLYKDQWYELPYSEGTLDRMSQQEQLRLFLLNDPTPAEDIEIRVADGKRIKDYKLVFVGEEVIETPMGALQTLHFERLHKDPERKSDTWVAPELDYLMVKTIHIEDGKPTEVIITRADIGEP